MKYMDFDTGEMCSENEIKEVFETEPDLVSNYSSFENYLECLLNLGHQRVGGIIEIETE